MTPDISEAPFVPVTDQLDAERARYRQHAAATEATAVLRAQIATRRHSASRPADQPQGDQEPGDHPAVHDPLATTGEHGDLSIGGGGSGTGPSGAPVTSTAGTAVSAVTDMGDQAHLGGTGVVSAASEANMQSDEPDDEVPVEPQGEQGAAAVVPPAGWQPSDLVPGDPPAWTAMRRGDSIPDAVVSRATGFSFDDGDTRQVSAFPRSLEQLLRADLETMTNQKFATELPLPALIAAFVAAQLGVVADDGESTHLDPNTRTAIKVFRMLDRRTGTIEERLSSLGQATDAIEDRITTMSRALNRLSEPMRRVEVAASFLVAERVAPSAGLGSGVRLDQLELSGGKYRQVRDRLRQVTDAEVRDEKLASGRPMR